MSHLRWRRTSDLMQIDAGVILRSQKMVWLQGDFYDVWIPTWFGVYRFPSAFAQAILGGTGITSARTYAQRRALEHRNQSPWRTCWSETPIMIANVGFCHTHRWRFTDYSDHWSEEIRLARFASITTKTRGQLGTPTIAPVAGQISGQVQATVTVGIDPEVILDIAFPWGSMRSPETRVQDLFALEISSLFGPDERAGVVMPERALELFSLARPRDFAVEWTPLQSQLDEGQTIEAVVTFSAPSETPFMMVPFCFCLRDVRSPASDLSSVLAASDIMIARAEYGVMRFDFTDDLHGQVGPLGRPESGFHLPIDRRQHDRKDEKRYDGRS